MQRYIENKLQTASVNISIPISNEDINCSISQTLLKNPTETQCGHIYERDELYKWRDNHDTCPFCREIITEVSPPSPFFKSLFEKTLVKYPELKDGKDINEAMTVNVDLNEFICPLSKKLFQKPVALLPCKHHAEEKDITERRKNNNTCPCCRADIKSMRAASPFFKTCLAEATKQYAKLIAKDNFTIHEFSQLVLGKVENPQRLEQYVEYLKKSDKLNLISEEKEHKHQSYVTWLTCTSRGREILYKNAEIRNNISEDSFNSIDQTGEIPGASPAFWLMVTDEGQEILKDKRLRDKISEFSMNMLIIKGPYSNTSAAYWLTSTREGRILLLDDDNFRSKILYTGLNAIKSEGTFTGASAVYWLASTHDGFAILLKDHRLRSIIHKSTLHECVLTGNEDDIGKTPAIWLNNTEEGLAILKLDKNLELKADLAYKSEPDISIAYKY